MYLSSFLGSFFGLLLVSISSVPSSICPCGVEVSIGDTSSLARVRSVSWTVSWLLGPGAPRCPRRSSGRRPRSLGPCWQHAGEGLLDVDFHLAELPLHKAQVPLDAGDALVLLNLGVEANWHTQVLDLGNAGHACNISLGSSVRTYDLTLLSLRFQTPLRLSSS